MIRQQTIYLRKASSLVKNTARNLENNVNYFILSRSNSSNNAARTNRQQHGKSATQQSNTNQQQSLAKILSNYENYKFRHFEDEVNLRRKQARNSILVRYQIKSDLARLIEDIELAECSIKSVFVFEDRVLNPYDGRTPQMAALVELARPHDLDKLINGHVKHMSSHYVPCRSRILFYRVFKTPKSNMNKRVVKTVFNLDNVNYSTDLSKFELGFEAIFRFLRPFISAHDEIENFYKRFKIDEFGYRIRYFVASVVEESVSGLFDNSICYPFGSSSNRFGQRGADLDLSLSWQNRFELIESNVVRNRDHDSRTNGAIFFQTKPQVINEDRAMARINLDMVEFILRTMLPRFEVKELLRNPRVPILKFKFDAKPMLECDLSMSQVRESFETTKLLWTYSQIDDRVGPLVFIVRYWAKLAHITDRERPTMRFTNFQLTVMVLAYLVRGVDPVIVPPLDEISRREKIDETGLLKNAYDEINCVDVDLNHYRNKRSNSKPNTSDLGKLFAGFLDYYSKYDFTSYSISLERDLKPKPKDTIPDKIHIENPIVTCLNASKNVNPAHLKEFIKCCQRSYVIIQSLNRSKTPGSLNYRISDLLNELMKECGNKPQPPPQSSQTSNIADEMNVI